MTQAAVDLASEGTIQAVVIRAAAGRAREAMTQAVVIRAAVDLAREAMTQVVIRVAAGRAREATDIAAGESIQLIYASGGHIAQHFGFFGMYTTQTGSPMK